MSSFIRTIQRTVKRDDEGNLKAARRQFGGRGSKLGVVNPKDPCRTHKRKVPCRTHKRKVPKPWRSAAHKPEPKVQYVSKPVRKPFDRVERHKSKMEWKARFKVKGPQPRAESRLEQHKQLREKARRVRQMGVRDQ